MTTTARHIAQAVAKSDYGCEHAEQCYEAHVCRPCGEMNEHCEAGYRAQCKCGKHDYHIVAEREQS